MSAANARNVTPASRGKWLARIATVALAASGLVLATSQIAHADEQGNGFCISMGNGNCIQADGISTIPGVVAYQNNLPAQFTIGTHGVGNLGCNNGRVATMAADGCWWPFGTHSFDTYYHGDVVITLLVPAGTPSACIAVKTADNSVRVTDCGGAGTQWVRDGDFGYVSVSDSDHQVAHEYLKKGTNGNAQLGNWAAGVAQWAFCKDTASGCVYGQ